MNHSNPNQTPQKRALCLMGPSSSGKTALAMALHAAAPSEVSLISVDALMVYRGLDIGTAKPSKTELESHPHALINHREIDEPYNVSLFLQDTGRILKSVFEEGKTPVLVGGSMMYFYALKGGKHPILGQDPAYEQEASLLLEKSGIEGLWQACYQIDSTLPEHIRDPQKLIRTYSVLRRCGSLHSSMRPYEPLAGIDWTWVAHAPKERRSLDPVILHRTKQMLKAGLIEETEAHLSRFEINQAPRSLSSIGYKEAGKFIRGKIKDKDSLILSINRATEGLVKRQMSWLHKWPEAIYLPARESMRQKLETTLTLLRDPSRKTFEKSLTWGDVHL